MFVSLLVCLLWFSLLCLFFKGFVVVVYLFWGGVSVFFCLCHLFLFVLFLLFYCLIGCLLG